MSRLQPHRVTVRSYNVGFGDCYLLRFHYRGRPNRHVLIDFGRTAGALNGARKSMVEIAEHIKKTCRGKLHLVVATHRHRDHISGFAGRSGQIIKQCRVERVLQPWTEDPAAPEDATRPILTPARENSHRRRLASIHGIARLALKEVDARGRAFSARISQELSFLGEENLSNAEAVKNLMSLAPNTYAYCGLDPGLGNLLPGVKVRVLGPPTLTQHEAVRSQRDEHPDEFWHLQARTAEGLDDARPLFAGTNRSKLNPPPPETRWLLPRLDRLRGDEILQIVRTLDDALNNTSLILHFEVGGKKLLFPGDAQFENWDYTLKKAKRSRTLKRRLAQVDLYKVGHHGSLNATPRTLWSWFAKKGPAGKPDRLITMMSTREDFHGHVESDTEVPRLRLTKELERSSDHFSTQQLKGRSYYKDIALDT